jgi:hypothetical protein
MPRRTEGDEELLLDKLFFQAETCLIAKEFGGETSIEFLSGDKSMRSNHRALLVLILSLVIGVFFLFVQPRRPAASPRVRIRFDGYVRSTGLAVFTISNASPFTIAYSGQYRIQLPVDGGWTNQAAAWLPTGAEMRSGQSVSITLSPPVGEKEWRADFDVFAHGYYAGKGRRFINQLGQIVGLSVWKAATYSRSSDSVTESLAEILERHRKASNRSER